jgi:hypothetical protein
MVTDTGFSTLNNMDYSKEVLMVLFWFEVIDQEEIERVMAEFLRSKSRRRRLN